MDLCFFVVGRLRSERLLSRRLCHSDGIGCQAYAGLDWRRETVLVLGRGGRCRMARWQIDFHSIRFDMGI